jgi:hypothetical protein
MNRENQQSVVELTVIRESEAGHARLIYEQPRLSHFGSLTELTKGGNFTGPDNLIPGNPPGRL